MYTKPKVLKEKPESDSLADHFIFYLKRDVLGKIANLHLALCDQKGKDGPKDPDCITLASLCAQAVDFAKHGECVATKDFEDL